MMHAVLRALARHCPEGYRVSYEVTHHGPTGLSHPSFFVEIGSTEKEWADPAAGQAVAEAVLDAIPLTEAMPLVGFGGTHYAVRETEIALATRGAFGHIAHTREIAALDEEMIRSMIEKSGAVAAYIDRKALDHAALSHLLGILDRIPVLRLSESEIAALGHLSWDTVLCRAGTGCNSLAPRPVLSSIHLKAPARSRSSPLTRYCLQKQKNLMNLR